MQVRHLAAEHDSTDLMAAMAEAMDTNTPALGVLFQKPRPTLGDTMDETIRAAGGKPFIEQAAVAELEGRGGARSNRAGGSRARSSSAGAERLADAGDAWAGATLTPSGSQRPPAR